MAETTAIRNIRVYEQLRSARSALDSYWQDIVYYTFPRKAYITRIKNMGDRLPTDIYDSTAILALAYFAAGMQAYMSSPQTRWFNLGVDDKRLAGNKEVIDFLRNSEDVIYSIINNTNFYQEDVESYSCLGSIGTDIIHGGLDNKDLVRFDSLPIETVYLAADSYNRVNQAYIKYEFDPAQAVDKFGRGAVGPEVNEKFVKADFSTKFEYILAIYPRAFYDKSKKDAKNMPFAAVWVDMKRKTVVRESGFKKFPFFVTRFNKGKGDPYGYSPAMNVLPDIMMLNAMEKTNILGAQNAVLPPLEIPDEAFLRPYNFNPGGKNIRQSGNPNEHITPIITGANVPIGIDYVKYKQARIEQALYNDLFLSLEQIGNRTATEVSIANNQRMQLLGSAVGNIMREKLSPIVEWVFDICAEAGKLPPLPDILRGKSYQVQYTSPLARAQKSLELNNLSQAISVISQFGTVQPDVFDKIDFDKLVDYTAEITDINPQVIRDDGEVQEIRDSRAQGQYMAQQMQLLQQGADAAKTAGDADAAIAESQLAGAK